MLNPANIGNQYDGVFEVTDSTEPLKSNYKMGLVVTAYNRPSYLHRTLSSLSKSDLSDTLIILVDDCSDNHPTKELLKSFYIKEIPVIKAFRKMRGPCSIHDNLRFGWDLLSRHFKCEYLTNLDSDALVKPYWLKRLQQLGQEQMSINQGVLVTGFNAYQHAVVKETETHYVKESMGGINFFFHTSLYEQVVRPGLVDLQWDDHVFKAVQGRGYEVVSTKPSVIQHIGRQGIWSGPASGIFDFAIDYGDCLRITCLLRLIYYRAVRKSLFISSPLFFKLKEMLGKVHFLPPQLSTRFRTFNNRTKLKIKTLWFRTVYRKLYLKSI